MKTSHKTSSNDVQRVYNVHLGGTTPSTNDEVVDYSETKNELIDGKPDIAKENKSRTSFSRVGAKTGSVESYFKRLIAFALIVTILLTGNILAYFLDGDTTNRVFTVGRIEVELEEPDWNPDDAMEILPDEEYSKNPLLKNIGVNDSYVFLEVTVPYANVTVASEDGTVDVKKDTQLFTWDINADWVQVGEKRINEDDMTYTYVYAYGTDTGMTVLPAGDSTSKLFTHVRFANVVEDQALEGRDLDIIINGYGIQTTNINDNDITIDGDNNDGKVVPEDVWNVVSKTSDSDSSISGDDSDLTEDYSVYNGDNQIYKISSGNMVSFSTDIPYEKFSHVKFDEHNLDKYSDYSVKKDSSTDGTIVTLSNDYLDVLSEGDYDLKIYAKDGYAIAELTTVYINILNLNNISTGYVGMDGVINSSVNTLSYTEKIPVKAGDTIDVWHFISGATNLQARFVTAYDKDGNVVAESSVDYAYSYTVPDGVAYVVFTLNSGSINDVMLLLNTVHTPTKYTEYNYDKLGAIDLNNFINVLNLEDVSTGYVTQKGIIDTSVTTLKYTKRIAVSEGDTFESWYFSFGPTNTTFRFITAYDENGKVVENSSTEAAKSYTVPEGVASLVFTVSAESVNELMILKNPPATVPCYIEYNGNNITMDVPAGEGFINLFNKDAVTDGYMGTNGGVSSSTSLCYSEKIDVEEGDVLYVWRGTSMYSPRFITAFDKDGKALSSSGSSSPSSTYTVPNGVSSLVFTVYTSSIDNIMIFKNNAATPPTYIEYVKEEVVLGDEYLVVYGDMVEDTVLSLGKADIITDKHLTFTADVDTFSGLRIGHGYQDYTANYIEIDNTSIKEYFYTNSATLQKEVEHGLTISNDIEVKIDVNERRVATITLMSNGKTYSFSTNTVWYGSNGNIYAESLNSVLPNGELVFTCDGYLEDIQFYGDSYLSQSSDRWLYFAFNDGYKNALFDGYGGRGSGAAYSSLLTNLEHSDPSVVVWMMGMNDGSDTDINTPSNTWVTNRDKLIALSEEKGFEIVFATIPTVPAINNEAKNKWIKESGYEYIDVASAVGADSTGSWTEGMLSSDNVHPTSLGAEAIYKQVIKDFPEFAE